MKCVIKGKQSCMGIGFSRRLTQSADTLLVHLVSNSITIFARLRRRNAFFPPPTLISKNSTLKEALKYSVTFLNEFSVRGRFFRSWARKPACAPSRAWNSRESDQGIALGVENQRSGLWLSRFWESYDIYTTFRDIFIVCAFDWDQHSLMIVEIWFVR